MKKRMLLLFAFGISFAPPVFAEQSRQLTVHAVGQLAMSKTDMRGARCEGQEKRLASDAGSSVSESNGGSSKAAGQAR